LAQGAAEAARILKMLIQGNAQHRGESSGYVCPKKGIGKRQGIAWSDKSRPASTSPSHFVGRAFGGVRISNDYMLSGL
jgi:hypothetical protein